MIQFILALSLVAAQAQDQPVGDLGALKSQLRSLKNSIEVNPTNQTVTFPSYPTAHEEFRKAATQAISELSDWANSLGDRTINPEWDQLEDLEGRLKALKELPADQARNDMVIRQEKEIEAVRKTIQSKLDLEYNAKMKRLFYLLESVKITTFTYHANHYSRWDPAVGSRNRTNYKRTCNIPVAPYSTVREYLCGPPSHYDVNTSIDSTCKEMGCALQMKTEMSDWFDAVAKLSNKSFKLGSGFKIGSTDLLNEHMVSHKFFKKAFERSVDEFAVTLPIGSFISEMPTTQAAASDRTTDSIGTPQGLAAPQVPNSGKSTGR